MSGSLPVRLMTVDFVADTLWALAVGAALTSAIGPVTKACVGAEKPVSANPAIWPDALIEYGVIRPPNDPTFSIAPAVELGACGTHTKALYVKSPHKEAAPVTAPVSVMPVAKA